MWQLIKSELKYYRIAFLALIFFTVLFQIFEFFVLKTMLELEGKISVPQIDRWNFTFFIFLFFSLFLMWQDRIKRKREKHLFLLPLSNKQLAVSRFCFTLIPFLIMLVYFITIYLTANTIWKIKLTIPYAEIGIMFSLMAIYILLRDSWFSSWYFWEKVGYVFIIGVLLFAPMFTLSYTIQINHESIIPIWGLPYDNIQYFLLGLIIMLATIFSYQKRKSYLS